MRVRNPARSVPLATACLVLLGAASVRADAAPQTYQVYNSPKKIESLVLEDPHYQHAATVAQFGSRVYVAWNGNNYNSSEGQPGQVIMLRTSDDDGAHWSKTIIPFSKEYRALDETSHKGVDAAPGDADDNHKVHDAAARQWQPSMTVFKGKLVMLWGMDRDAPGSALMLSVLEPDGAQWRSSEMHFKPDGTPYMAAEINGAAGQSSDPSYLQIGGNARYAKILGSDTFPQQLRLDNVNPALLKAEVAPAAAPAGGGDASGPLAAQRGENMAGGGLPHINGSTIGLQGMHLVPSPNQSAVVKLKDGSELLAISVILEQTGVDWNNLALKIPAVLTTTDMQNWQLSVVPMKTGSADFLNSQRGDLGLTSAWEPTIDVDANGNAHMEFRINLPPRVGATGDPDSGGYRAGGVIGTFLPGQGVRWQPAHIVDYDLAVSRATITKLEGNPRWVMAGNNNVQGASYDGRSAAPAFRAEKFEPWSRENITLFFSTRGDDDFVSGLNISGDLDAPGAEEVHYPYIQSAAIGGKGDDLLAVFSTHRREPVCKGGIGPEPSCHDSIRFVRIKELPDPSRPAIYPNHFAHTFAYGNAKPQDKAYGVSNNVLTLVDRGSAGIETAGDTGCVNLTFKLSGQSNDTRPVLSFGRTADRTGAIGLTVQGNRLLLGSKPVGGALTPNQWTTTRVCYDYKQGKLTAGGTEWSLGAGALSQRTYLGDQTLARRAAKLPDLSIDLAQTSLEAGVDH